MTKYNIELKGGPVQLALAEMGNYLSHDDKEAEAPDHDAGSHLVVQWVLVGTPGSSLGLTYENDRGKRVIVQSSKITSPTGVHQSGAVFKVP